MRVRGGDTTVPSGGVLAQAHVDCEEELREEFCQELESLDDGCIGRVGS